MYASRNWLFRSVISYKATDQTKLVHHSHMSVRVSVGNNHGRSLSAEQISDKFH
jgi:hypothetical protein